jgi:hypothetical protein
MSIGTILLIVLIIILLVLLSQKVATNDEENHLFGKIHTSAMGVLKWICQDRMTVKHDFRFMWRGSRA